MGERVVVDDEAEPDDWIPAAARGLECCAPSMLTAELLRSTREWDVKHAQKGRNTFESTNIA
jgi:hypothetical protein